MARALQRAAILALISALAGCASSVDVTGAVIVPGGPYLSGAPCGGPDDPAVGGPLKIGINGTDTDLLAAVPLRTGVATTTNRCSIDFRLHDVQLGFEQYELVVYEPGGAVRFTLGHQPGSRLGQPLYLLLPPPR